MKRDGAAGERKEKAALDERAVLLRLRDGDRSGLGDLVDRYGEELMRYLVHILGDRDAAEDAFQDTWVRVAGSVKRFDPDRAFAPWLFRIGRNRALDMIRAGKRWGWIGLDKGEPVVRTPAAPAAPDPAERAEAKDLTAKLLARLDPASREVIGLRFFGGRSYQEIADICRVPIGTVKSRINRAMDVLADQYARLEGNDA